MSSRATLRRWLPALLLALLLAVVAVIAYGCGVTVGTMLRWAYERTQHAPWLLMILFFLRPPFIVPVSLPVFLCGALWGLWPGGLYAVIGMMLSAASSYALARYVLPAKSILSDKAPANVLSRWFERLRRDGFLTVCIMRVMLLPFDPVNFAAAGLGVNFRRFYLATLLGNTVATVLYASVGAAIHLDTLMSGQAHVPLGDLIDVPQILFALAMILASMLVARIIRRRQIAQTSPR
ncbi:MAG: TVP38/TMEM64 family protein [Stenotrophobium sp.]